MRGASPEAAKRRVGKFSLAGPKIKLSAKNVAPFRRALLRWYDGHRRDLPWRATREPYRVWLSEIMLQQTRVNSVLEHYRIFLERFPDVQTLAEASEDSVLAAWSGLGYYRRARMLHRCAKEIVEDHEGEFPRTSEALLALPGIGRYTAAAIASIAYGEPVAVVDGNVERVLQRLLGRQLSPSETWREAQQFLARSRPGDFNQAMMELGATVCVPAEPRCLTCPVRSWCTSQGELPRTQLAPPQNKRELWCSLEYRAGNGDGSGRVRLVQRPRKLSLMPGMWELPQSSEVPNGWPGLKHWRTFRHSITVTNYTVHVLRNAESTGSATIPKGKWIRVDRISRMPITGLTRKILKAGDII